MDLEEYATVSKPVLSLESHEEILKIFTFSSSIPDLFHEKLQEYSPVI